MKQISSVMAALLAPLLAGAGENLIANPGFEQELTGWKTNIVEGKYRFVIDRVQRHSGAASAKLETVEPGWGRYIQSIPVEKGKTYRLTFFAKGEDVRLTAWIYNPKFEAKKHFQLTMKEWQKIQLDVSAQETTKVGVFLQLAPGKYSGKRGSAWFDDVSFEEVEPVRPLEFNGKTFLCSPRNPAPDPGLAPELRARYGAAGVIPFRRNDPRFFYRDSVPQKNEEIPDGLSAFAAPGQRFADNWVMLHALKPVEGAMLSVKGEFADGAGRTLPASSVEVREIVQWPQRVNWSTTEYYEIPEKLEPVAPRKIAAAECAGYWISLRLPDDIAPGDYRGMLEFTGENIDPVPIPFLLRILPFRLLTAQDRDWVIYPDDARWDTMSDAEMRRDLLDLTEYGMTNFILELWAGKENAMMFSRSPEGKIVFSSDRLARFMKLRRELGLRGPVLICAEKYLECRVGKLIGLNIPGNSRDLAGNLENPELKAAFVGGLRAIDAFLREQNGGEEVPWIYFGVDEPFANGYMPKALWEYRTAHEAGVKTGATIYPIPAVKEISPNLDVDISGSSNRREHKERLALMNRGVWWFLATSCYTGQEGGLMPNRGFAGFEFFRTGAAAEVSWTYQRPNQSPLTDFDGTGAEQKDACTTYPASPRTPERVSISTLQWEGMRQGVDDYRYCCTLAQTIREARERGFADAADRSAEKFRKLLDRIPDREKIVNGTGILSPGNFPASAAENCRRAIAAEILTLRKLLDAAK